MRHRRAKTGPQGSVDMEKRSDSLGRPIARDAFDCAEVLVLLCAAQPCDAERAARLIREKQFWHVVVSGSEAARMAEQLRRLPGMPNLWLETQAWDEQDSAPRTRALLEGKPANNVLLYGDAGTGKSSAIKAIANAFAEDGLRLVEVKKNQLYQIPDLMDALAANPLKFILFIDDLSFTANDDNFAALKAILEGSVGGRAHNIAVYATSNRRHLIKETLTDRTGDDIHESDTRQELMSLSARFGLTITFGSPDRDRYLYIVKQLAKQYGLEMDERELSVRSEAFAIRAGGRSARVAKQFIELCKAGVPY